jgi:hypothetical protein
VLSGGSAEKIKNRFLPPAQVREPSEPQGEPAKRVREPFLASDRSEGIKYSLDDEPLCSQRRNENALVRSLESALTPHKVAAAFATPLDVIAAF